MLGGNIRIENCPKSLNRCPESACPMYPCWAYEQHMDCKDKEKTKRDEGWE